MMLLVSLELVRKMLFKKGNGKLSIGFYHVKEKIVQQNV